MIKAGGALQESLHGNKQLVAGFIGNQKRHISVILTKRRSAKTYPIIIGCPDSRVPVNNVFSTYERFICYSCL
jgi:carbonic anhydrase